jgi:drug/metabolite transporter (DMT)-like permease
VLSGAVLPTGLALSSSLMWGTADFLGGTYSRRIAAIVVVTVSQAAALLVFLVMGLVVGDYGDLAAVAPVAVVGGAAGGAALLAFYAALASGTMSVVAPLAALGVVVPVGFGILSGERPSVAQLAGVTFGVVGSVLATARTGGTASRRSALLALLAGLGFGVTLVVLAEGSRNSELMTLLGMRLTSVPLLALVLLLLVRRGRVAATLPRRDVPGVAGVGLLDGGANLTYALAVGLGGLVSLMSVLSSLYPAVTVVLARAVHHERMTRLQTIGVMLALLGVALIAGG